MEELDQTRLLIPNPDRYADDPKSQGYEQWHQVQGKIKVAL